MEVIAKFQIDRIDGKTESRENVEAEFQTSLEDLDQFDVEDSVYEVQEAEIIASPKAASGGQDQAKLGAALLRLATVYFDARPVVLGFDGPAVDKVRDAFDSEEKALDDAIFHLLNEASPTINKAKQAAFKAKKGGK